MSENKEMLALIDVMKESMTHSITQNTKTNDRMDKLIDGQIVMNEQVAKLSNIINIVELRHDQNSTGLERLGNQQDKDRDAFEKHKELIIGKVTNLEKFNIAIKLKSEGVTKWMDRIDARKAAIWTSIITAVLGSAVLIFLGLK